MNTTPIVSQSEPALDSRSFRRCLGMFATGVTVVTAQAGDRLAGITANSFASVSLDPPLILWSIKRTARSFGVFQDASHFAVNILAADQIDVSQRFSSADPDRFARALWRSGADGAPLLEGVVAHFECSTEAQYDGGDHLIILGRVRRFSHFEGGCLLFAQGRYGVVEDHPEMKRAQQATPRQPGDILGDSATLRLLFNALHYTYAEFERSRLADGLTIAQIRALNGLYETPGIGAAELANRMYLGQRDTEDALGDLVDSGDVLQTGDSFELTPSGRERREAIRRRIREFEKAFLADIPESEIAIGRRFLERLIAKHGASNPLSG